MSTGGIFQLITNDGKQDKLLMATQLLNRRLAAVRRARAAAGLDPTPTLADIEKTHVLFTNAHFKPFTAVASEYNKVRAKGNYNLGQSLQFSIPQFGDFFADMILHMTLDVSNCLTQPTNGAMSNDKMQFCPWLGERILEKVSFTVNGNPLDEYTPNCANVWREFYVQENKKKAYARCMGQEMIEKGVQTHAGKTAPNSANVEFACARPVLEYKNGLQTPKFAHGPNNDNKNIELWIPLLFWFNKDIRLAIPSVAIPYGQRYVKIQTAAPDKVIGFSNASETPTDEALSTDSAWYNRNNKSAHHKPAEAKVDMELYINNLFVNPEIHEIFIKRIGFNLIRVHREQTFLCEKNEEELLLSQMKWPIETLYVGMRPNQYNSNSAAEKARYMDRWNCYQKSNKKVLYSSQSGHGNRLMSTGALHADVSDTVVIVKGLDTGTYKNGICTNGHQYMLTARDPTGKLYVCKAKVVNAIEFNGTAATTTDGQTVPMNNPLDRMKLNVEEGSFVGLKANQAVHIYGVADKIQIGVPQGSTTTVKWNGNRDHYIENTNADISALTRDAYEVYDKRAMLDSIKISAHGIPIYNKLPAQFFSKYAPYHYGGPNLKAPDDEGLLMLNFCLYPGSYQPSGHINVSRAREFYIQYKSSVVGKQRDYSSKPEDVQQGQLVVVASAINFLLISDGSAVLRYST